LSRIRTTCPSLKRKRRQPSLTLQARTETLVKPLVAEILRAKVEVFLALYQRTEQVRQLQTPPDVRERTQDMMERQLRHLSQLIDDLLDVSHIVRGKIQLRKERLELRKLVRTVAEDRRAVLDQAGLTLVLETSQTPTCVMGDPTRLTQILNNLLE
jgi:signal transduction histidine kinase